MGAALFCQLTIDTTRRNSFKFIQGRFRFFKYPRGYLKEVQMWHLGMWFSGGLGSVRVMVGLNDIKGLFQPKLFYDSIILKVGGFS